MLRIRSLVLSISNLQYDLKCVSCHFHVLLSKFVGGKDLNEPWEGFFKGNPMNSFCKTTFKAGGSLLLALQGPHNLMTVLLLVDGLLCGPGIAQLCF